MNDEQKVIDAIAELLSTSPDDSVPNVKAVSDLVGFKVTAAQRDEALKAHLALVELDGGGDVKGVEDVEPVADVVGTDSPTIINNAGSPLPVQGVVIPAGESMPVPGFDPSIALNNIWLNRGVISAD